MGINTMKTIKSSKNLSGMTQHPRSITSNAADTQAVEEDAYFSHTMPIAPLAMPTQDLSASAFSLESLIPQVSFPWKKQAIRS